MAKLQHPNIVRCLGATQQPGCFNIFLEWMAGVLIYMFVILNVLVKLPFQQPLITNCLLIKGSFKS